MKAFLLTALLVATTLTQLAAQSRFSLAPTVWFTYNPYAYQATLTYNGVSNQLDVAGYGLSPAIGMTARYQLTPRWDVATGLQYFSNTSYPTRVNSPYGRAVTFTSRGFQVPIVLSYRFAQSRLSPYASVGALLVRNTTFTEAPLRTDGLVGLGIDYRLKSGLSLLLQPTAGYSFSRPANDAYFQYSRYQMLSAGLQVQLIWHL